MTGTLQRMQMYRSQGLHDLRSRATPIASLIKSMPRPAWLSLHLLPGRLGQSTIQEVCLKLCYRFAVNAVDAITDDCIEEVICRVLALPTYLTRT